MVLQKGRKEDKIRHLGVRGRREGRGGEMGALRKCLVALVATQVE